MTTLFIIFLFVTIICYNLFVSFTLQITTIGYSKYDSFKVPIRIRFSSINLFVLKLLLNSIYSKKCINTNTKHIIVKLISSSFYSEIDNILIMNNLIVQGWS